MNHLQKIIERVNRNGEFYEKGTPTPLLTINEFFEGNDIVGSIGCNLEGEPHPSELKTILQNIKNQADVFEVYIQITEMDDPDWPFSDTAWVITTATDKEIAKFFPDKLAPNEIWEGFIEGNNYESIEIPKGNKLFACWWD